jgi:thiosulfate/3-mercaptopyruvate sulfurtransferase
VTLLDARAGERFRGEIEPIDPIPGHIPTAISAPTMDNVDGSGYFRDQSVLKARFAGLVADDRATVNYCGSGTNACHNALAMRLAGLPDPILYVGSYSDWSRSGMPIEPSKSGQ